MDSFSLVRPFVLAWGGVRCFWAFSAGLLSAFSLPPFGIPLFLAIGLPVLLFLLDGVYAAKNHLYGLLWALLTGFCFGCGYFLPTIGWFGFSLWKTGSLSLLELPLFLFIFPGLLASSYGVGAGFFYLLGGKKAWRIPSFAFSFFLAELLYCFLFPHLFWTWNLAGSALAQYSFFLPGVSLIGIQWLSFLSFFLFSLPAIFFDSTLCKKERILLSLVGTILFTGYTLLGNRTQPSLSSPASSVRIRILSFTESSASQALDPWKRLENLLQSSLPEKNPSQANFDLLLWPELALPFSLIDHLPSLHKLSISIPSKSLLLTGSVRKEEIRKKKQEKESPSFNSLYAVQPSGKILWIYDKIEPTLFREFFPFFSSSHTGKSVFLPGKSRNIVSLQGIPSFLPLLSQEIASASPYLYRPDKEKAAWVFNPSDDQWIYQSLGRWSFLYPNLYAAQLYAVQQKIPVIRVSHGGPSFVIDEFGKVLHILDSPSSNFFDLQLPVTSQKEPFFILGDIQTSLSISLILLLLVVFLRGIQIRSILYLYR